MRYHDEREVERATAEVQASASTLGKLSARRRLGQMTPEEKSQWGRQLGQIWRDRKAAQAKAANQE